MLFSSNAYADAAAQAEPSPLFTFIMFGGLFMLVCFYPNLLGHSSNYVPANPLSTPTHIVPE